MSFLVYIEALSPFWQSGKSALQCLLCTSSLPSILTTDFWDWVRALATCAVTSASGSLTAQYGWRTALTHWLSEHFRLLKNYNSSAQIDNSRSHPHTGSKTGCLGSRQMNCSISQSFGKNKKQSNLSIFEKQELGKRVSLCSFSLNFYSFIILIAIK